MLSKAELKTLLYLIDLAADKLSNNCCNDLRLLTDCKLTRDEAQSIRELEHQYSYSDMDVPPQILPLDHSEKEVYATDWLVLQALAAKLKVAHEGAT